MPRAQFALPERLRERIFERDPRVLEDVDGYLRRLRLADEPRQHVLMWLDRVMRNQDRLSHLTEIADLGDYFRAVGRRYERTKRKGDQARASNDRVAGKGRAAIRTERRLTDLEICELVSLVFERIRKRSELDAQLFREVALRNLSYEQVVANLSGRFNALTTTKLRRRVARIRERIRKSLGWYLRIGPTDVIVTEPRGGDR